MECGCCLHEKSENSFHKIELSLAGNVLLDRTIEEICIDCLDMEDVLVSTKQATICYEMMNKPKYNKRMIKNLMGDQYYKYYYGYGECVKALNDMGYNVSVSSMKSYNKEYIVEKGFYTRRKININMFKSGQKFGWIYPKKEFHKYWDLRINGKFRSVKESKIEFDSDKLDYLLENGYYFEHKNEGKFWAYINTVDGYSFCDICGGKTKMEDFAKATNNCWVWECFECRSKKNKEQYANMPKKEKEAFKNKMKEYNKSEAAKESRRKYDKRKYEEDPKYRFNYNLRRSLLKNLKGNGWSKKTNTYKYIGATKEEFEAHIESQFEVGMCWDNWGFDGWHLDHRLPLSAAKTEEEAVMLWHYTNLQPMWGAENIAKGDKYCPEQLEAFLEERRATK